MKTDDNSNKNHDTSVDSIVRVMEERIRPEVIQEFYDLMESSADESFCTGINSKFTGLAKSASIESLRETGKMES